MARKGWWNLAQGHSAWVVMALWDLHLESKSSLGSPLGPAERADGPWRVVRY